MIKKLSGSLTRIESEIVHDLVCPLRKACIRVTIGWFTPGSLTDVNMVYKSFL